MECDNIDSGRTTRCIIIVRELRRSGNLSLKARGANLGGGVYCPNNGDRYVCQCGEFRSGGKRGVLTWLVPKPVVCNHPTVSRHKGRNEIGVGSVVCRERIK